MADKKGFTIIELLLVISIVGLLSSLILVGYPNIVKQARDSRRKHDISQVMRSLEVYYENNGHYPESGGADSPNNAWDNTNNGSWGDLEKGAIFGVKKSFQIIPYVTAVASPGGDPAPPPPPTVIRDPINTPTGWAGDGTGRTYVYNYYSRSTDGGGQWYMIVYGLENKTDPDLANSPGVISCGGVSYNYSNAVTVGRRRNCP